MYDLKELGLLAAALVVRKVPFAFDKCLDGWRIATRRWSANINLRTNGSEDGLLELDIWELGDDHLYGNRTASEIMEILENKGLFLKKV